MANIKPKTLELAEALGRERVVAYLLALWTGLRRSELRALEWRDVELETLPPRIVLRAHTTKAKRSDTLALHPQIADALAGIRPGRSAAGSRVLRTVPGVKVLHADLKLAGIKPETSAGRVDLHSMRKSLATFLAGHGVPQRIAQSHLRHTDPRLTAGTYTDERLLPMAGAISALPHLPTHAPGPPSEPLRATGTDGAQLGAQRTGRDSGQFPALAGTVGTSEGGVSACGNGLNSQHLALPDTKRAKGLEPSTFTLAT